MQQRYYDPVIGRFYSNDPVGFSASNPMMFNRYAYANNNPYRFTDPDGRTAESFFVSGKQYETQMQAVSNAWGDFKASLDTSISNSVATASEPISPFPSSGTVEYGGAATVSVLGSATGSVTVAMDSNKNVAVNLTGGVGLGGLGASAELVRTTTSAQNVSDLAGAGGVATIGAGEGLGGSVSYVEGTGYTGKSVGLGATIGIGPVSGSVHKTYTVQPFNSQD